ncbi:MAG: CpaF family protein [Lachnospiraceae bacterium]|nr:CpaF family protein [Lachnospiraceae bacterium]
MVEKELLRRELWNRIDYSREISDDEILEMIDELILQEVRKGKLSLEERKKLRTELFHAVRKLDILQDLVDDPAITEIMINGKDRIFVEKKGKMERLDAEFDSEDKLQNVIQQIVASCNRVVNESTPIVDARLDNGSRVNIVLKPIALNGPIVTIRRFPEKPISMEDLIAYRSINRELANFLQRLVRAKYNIFVSGGTGSGKTTFLNVLSNFIPADERIITIEDSAELQLFQIENLVSLETRNANVENCREISIRDLIKTSLRMRPSRVIVGEVRGGEALDMLQAMNTGHDGSMSTGHANSAKDMLARLETMVLMGMDLPLSAIRQQIAAGIDVIVHLGRLRDKSRKILEVVEVTGYADGEITLSPLYQFEERKSTSDGNVQGEFAQKNKMQFLHKLQTAGLG